VKHLCLLIASLFLASGLVAEPEPPGSFSSREDAEHFLRTAEVVSIKPLGRGVTLSHVVTLTDGERTARAVRKTIDEYIPVKRFNDGGPPELGFRDSYKSEIAAYELDRLIGLDQVPPTVERKIRGETGSLQLWMDDCITEGERRREGVEPPDAGRWNQQMRRVKVFFQLIQDVDYVNLSNLLIDPEFKVYKIDSSRAFRTQTSILDPEKPSRYSRELLAGLKSLDEPTLKKQLGKWLSKVQRTKLLQRRNLIIQRAERLIAERGEESVLYP